MAKRYNLYGRKKHSFAKVMMSIILVTGTLAGVLSICMLVTNIKAYRSSKEAAQMTETMVSLQEELTNIKQQEVDYIDQLESLKQEISQYKPVVIPDSMKTSK